MNLTKQYEDRDMSREEQHIYNEYVDFLIHTLLTKFAYLAKDGASAIDDIDEYCRYLFSKIPENASELGVGGEGALSGLVEQWIEEGREKEMVESAIEGAMIALKHQLKRAYIIRDGKYDRVSLGKKHIYFRDPDNEHQTLPPYDEPTRFVREDDA